MKRIIVKALVAVGLTILLGMDIEMKIWEYFLFGILIFFVVSWFGFIYRKLYGFIGIVRCIIALVATALILTLPAELWAMVLPDSGLRSFLQGITTLIICIIPVICDWKSEKDEI